MEFYPRKDSPYLWVDITLADGRRIRRSTGETEEQKALARINQIIPELLDLPGPDGMTLKQAFAKYYMEHARHTDSAHNILDALDRMETRIGGSRIFSKLKQHDIHTYRESRKADPPRRRKGLTVTPRTVNADLEYLRAVVNMARDTWGMPAPAIDFAALMLEIPEPRHRWYKLEEVQAMLDTAKARFPIFWRILFFALNTGVRRSNVETMDWEQIDLTRAEATFRVKSKKPGKKRLVVPLNDAVVALLANLPGPREGRVWRHDDGTAVADTEYWWQTTKAEAGVQDARWHDWRGTCANWMHRYGQQRAETIQKILGHARIETTLGYLDIDEEDKRQAVRSIVATTIDLTPPAPKLQTDAADLTVIESGGGRKQSA